MRSSTKEMIEWWFEKLENQSRTHRHNNLNIRSFAEDVEEEERLSGNVVRMKGVQLYGVIENVSTRG